MLQRNIRLERMSSEAMAPLSKRSGSNRSASTRSAADPSAPLGLTYRETVIIIVGLMLGMFLSALDQTIVATALPRIAADLGGMQHLSWVVSAYLLTSTAATPIYGKLSDLYGRKIM